MREFWNIGGRCLHTCEQNGYRFVFDFMFSLYLIIMTNLTIYVLFEICVGLWSPIFTDYNGVSNVQVADFWFAIGIPQCGNRQIFTINHDPTVSRFLLLFIWSVNLLLIVECRAVIDWHCCQMVNYDIIFNIRTPTMHSIRTTAQNRIHCGTMHRENTAWTR